MCAAMACGPSLERSERAGLDQEDERGSREPAEQGEFDARGPAKRSGGEDPDKKAHDRANGGLGKPQADLGEEFVHVATSLIERRP